MKLVVIIWQVPATGVSIEYNPASKGIYPDDILYITNPYDSCAVEEAIRMRDSQTKGTVTVVAIGPPRVEAALRSYLAMGADTAIHITGRSDSHDIYSLCAVLSQVIKNGEYDLILCGEEMLDNFGCTAYPGPYLAGMLRLPQVSNVTKVEYRDEEIVAHRKIERGDREVVRCPLPCVIAVDKSINEPRYPAFPNLLESARRDILTLDITSLEIEDLETSANFVKTLSFSTPHKRVKKVMSIDTSLSAANRMKMIMTGGLSQKNSRRLLTGETHEIAQNIMSILKNNGIIQKTSD